MTPEPGVLEKEATESRTKLAPPWKVLVHDDPITLMVYVTMVFQKLFGYPYQQAYQLMVEVHTRGLAVVWTGAREQAETYVQKLQSHQLLATMEQVDE